MLGVNGHAVRHPTTKAAGAELVPSRRRNGPHGAGGRVVTPSGGRSLRVPSRGKTTAPRTSSGGGGVTRAPAGESDGGATDTTSLRLPVPLRRSGGPRRTAIGDARMLPTRGGEGPLAGIAPLPPRSSLGTCRHPSVLLAVLGGGNNRRGDAHRGGEGWGGPAGPYDPEGRPEPGRAAPPAGGAGGAGAPGDWDDAEEPPRRVGSLWHEQPARPRGAAWADEPLEEDDEEPGGVPAGPVGGRSSGSGWTPEQVGDLPPPPIGLQLVPERGEVPAVRRSGPQDGPRLRVLLQDLRRGQGWGCRDGSRARV